MEGPCAWGLMVCDWCLEILNFIFEFVFCKWSLMVQWSTCREGLATARSLPPGLSRWVLHYLLCHPLVLQLSLASPPSPVNAVALCPWSEPEYGCEKGQQWHAPYSILRWGMETAVLPRVGNASEYLLGTGQGQASCHLWSRYLSHSIVEAAIPTQWVGVAGLWKGEMPGLTLSPLARHRVLVWYLAGEEIRHLIAPNQGARPPGACESLCSESIHVP